MGRVSTVYFLGAGASADAGVPLTSDLLPRLVERVPDKPNVGLYEFVRRFGFDGKEESVVDLINFVNSALREGQPLDRDFDVTALRALRDEITVELAFLIDESANRGRKLLLPEEAEDQPFGDGYVTDRKIAPYFKTFAKTLNTRRRRIGARLPRGDVVITTNYDTNLDAALFELSYADETGFDRGQSGLTDVYLGSAEFRDPYTDEYAFSASSATVDLLKLHGSFNWLYCPRCHRIFVAAFGSSVRFLQDPVGNPDETICFCDQPLESVIVAPSAEQEVVNPHLRGIWVSAYHALEQADRIVICGYSLPPQDLAIRSLFYRAMDGRRQQDMKPSEIVVVNRSTEDAFRERYTRLFGPHCTFVRKTFKRWVAGL